MVKTRMQKFGWFGRLTKPPTCSNRITKGNCVFHRDQSTGITNTGQLLRTRVLR
ncbi:hypothetical protein ACRRTK_017281 [Alexandromys fortis]